MKKYYISNMRIEDFLAQLVLCTSDSPLSNITDIEKQVSSISENGKILIDQILHVGNTAERFIEFEMCDGKIKNGTIKFSVVPKHSIIRERSRKILCDNNLIEYSILSRIQKRMLQKGIAL